MDGRVKKGIMLVIITDSPQDKESLLVLRRIVQLVDASRSNSRTEAAENETTDVLQMLGIGPVHRWDEVIEVISGDWATQRQPQSSSLNHGGLQPFAICLLFQHVSDVSPPKSEMQISEDFPISSQHQPTAPKDSAKAPAFAAFGAGVATQHHSRCSELRAALRATVGAAHLVALGR